MHKSAFRSLWPLLLTAALGLIAAGCSKPDYTDHLGNEGRFSDLKGQWMLINYWAIWCKPCIEEIPELNEFAHQQAGTAVIFGVDFDQSSASEKTAAIKKLGIEFAVLNEDPAQTLGYTRPKVLPTTLVFNPRGELVKTLTGPQTKQTLLAALREK